MLEHGFFGHDSRDGTAFSDRIRRHYTNRGWRTWSVGEALLSGTGGDIEARAIVKAWLDSRHTATSSCHRHGGIPASARSTRRPAPSEYGGAETIVVTADFGLREGKLGSP